MRRNIRLKLVTGQAIIVNDVTDWTVDTLGLHITVTETSKEKVGEEFKEIVTTTKSWFNSAGLLTFGEEYVK